MLLHLFVVIAAWSWVGLTLATFGWFRLPLVAGISAIFVCAGFVLLRREQAAASAPLNRGWTSMAWLAAWTLLAIAVFVPPGEYAVDGADGSVYLNIGAAVAQHGSLRFEEPLVTLTPVADRAHVFKTVRGLDPVFDLFPGGLQIPRDGAVVRPSFFHLYPVWIATADAIAGVRGGYHVSWVFAVLGIVATWSAARALSTLMAANVTAGLLCINFAEVWFARSPSSETLAQYFVMSGLAFTVTATSTRSRAMAACAGAAFGLAACTRIDMLMLVSPIVAIGMAVAALRGRWTPVWTAMAIPFAALHLQAIAHGLLISGPYTLRVLRLTFAGRDVSYLALALPVVIVAVGLWVWLTGGGQTGRRRWMHRVVASAVAILLILRLAAAFTVGYLPLLVTPVVTLLAIAGVALMLRQQRSEPELIAIGIFVISALVYAESVRDRPEMPQLFRRFVPVVLPLALLFAAHALDVTGRAIGRWRAVVLIVPLALAVRYAADIRPIVASGIMQDVHAQVAGASRLLPSSSVLIVDASTPSHLGASLRHLFSRDVIFVHPGEEAGRVIRGWAASLEQQGRPLLIGVGAVADSAGTPILTADTLADLALSPEGTIAFDFRQLAPTADRLPGVVRRVQPVVELFRVRRAVPVALPLQVEIGDHDLGHRVEGFYAREEMGGAATRWTNGHAVILLPQFASAPTRLLLRVAGPRPQGAPAPRLRAAIDGEPIGTTAPLAEGFSDFVLRVPAHVAERLTKARLRLTLSTPVFVPSASGESADSRTLGIVVDWVRFEGS